MNIFEKAITKMEKMQENDKGEMAPNTIIGLAVSVIIVSAVLPSALTTLFDVNTSTWGAGAAALWDALPLVIIAAVVIAYYTTKKGQ